MSTSTPESRELLRLYKCVVETGTGVVTAFALNKLLAAYNGNFKQFLDDKKHELFHLWQSKKLSCCECPPAGYTFKRMSHMDNWILKKLYADNGPENRSHILRNGTDVVQVCLHKYVTRSIAIHELDISAISFLLRNLIILSANETTTLDIITTTRSKICHAYSINCYTMTLLNSTWTELENALVDLTDPSYKWSTRQQIKYLRKIDLEKEEITELLSKVEEVLREVKSRSNNNVGYLNGMETRLRNESINNTDAINQHTTEETSYYAAQAQQALSEKIQHTEENIHKEVKEVKTSQENSYQKIGTELHETRSDIKEVKENQEKTQVTLVEMSRTIKNLEMFVSYERPNVLVPEVACSDAMERPVMWQFATPRHWNLEDVEATMRNPSQKDDFFKIKFVKKGSLIMLTTIAASVLSDSQAFEAAVMSFLTKMIEDCNINTEISSRVDVRLHILNANEVSLSCELPLEVRHEQASGFKKLLAESVIPHVAFLNGDDKKEIEWVQDVSTKLKSKFDINCAVLAKDYLNGFPLRKSLCECFNMFQAVIVTLTKDNYEQYDFYVKDDIQVIVVELEHLNEIRLNLRKCQHINCTICEHLWFPRLMNILKTKLPADILRKNIENYTDEVDVNCEKCMLSVTTVVFHLIEIEVKKTFIKKRFLFCGSLADEPWILDLFYQMTNFTEPYRITTWIKSIGTPCTFITNTVVVLNSPNLIKCERINEYFDSNYLVTLNTLYLVKIAPTERRPYFTHLVDGYINATSMNYKELADKIFASDENLTSSTDSCMLDDSRSSVDSLMEDDFLSTFKVDTEAKDSRSSIYSLKVDDILSPHKVDTEAKEVKEKTLTILGRRIEESSKYSTDARDPFLKGKKIKETHQNPLSKGTNSYMEDRMLRGTISYMKDRVLRENTSSSDFIPMPKDITAYCDDGMLRGVDGRITCKRCKRKFTKEILFNTHKCMGLSDYVDITKKQAIGDSDLPSKRKKIKENQKNPWSKDKT